MTRPLLALPLLIVACGGEVGIGQLDTDDGQDLSLYDGASMRIVEPVSASFLPLGQEHTFRAEVYDIDGNVIDEAFDVAWDSSADAAWAPTGTLIQDGSIDVGLHDLTAEVVLPNGDRLAHTVGGVLVQAESAGTYVGTLSGGTTIQQIPVSCAGAAVLVVDPYGEVVDGTAECVIRFDQTEIPLDYTVEATLEPDGPVQGTVAAQVFGFPLEFDAEGALQGEELDLDFSGVIIANEFTGSIRTTRINRDAGL